MKILAVIVPILLVSSSCNITCQKKKEGVVGGTIIIIAIGSDGIILGADSRVVWKKEYGGPANFYLDSAAKINFVQGRPVGCSGVANYNNDYISDVVNQYNRFSQNRDPYNTLSNFIAYLTKKYPIAQYPELNRNYYFTGGYVNDTPNIYVGVYPRKNNESYQIYSRQDSFYTNNQQCYDYLKKLYKNKMPCVELEKIVEKTINHMAEIDTTYEIGGPVSILKIYPSFKIYTNNKTEWLQNDFSKKLLGKSSWHKIKR